MYIHFPYLRSNLFRYLNSAIKVPSTNYFNTLKGAWSDFYEPSGLQQFGRFGPSCILKLGQLGPSCLGPTFFYGPSCPGPTCLWAELSCFAKSLQIVLIWRSQMTRPMAVTGSRAYFLLLYKFQIKKKQNKKKTSSYKHVLRHEINVEKIAFGNKEHATDYP